MLFIVASRNVAENLISENDYDTIITISAEEVKESDKNVKCVN